MSDSALIRLSGVTKTYGSGQAAFEALKGIDLAIDPGDFVAVMGPSGSGKSTVMNILGCLDTPSSGTYTFQGIRVEQLTRNQRALLRRNYLGFVFQGFNLLARTTALENVELPLIYRGEPAAARHAAARAALEQVGLQGREHRRHVEAGAHGGGIASEGAFELVDGGLQAGVFGAQVVEAGFVEEAQEVRGDVLAVADL